jgi:hypothetical protein
MFLDHFQYDMLNTVSVPEPSTFALAALGAAALYFASRVGAQQKALH